MEPAQGLEYLGYTYTDRSNDIVNLNVSDENTFRQYKEGVIEGPLPIKLHILLKLTEKLGKEHIVTWLSHGRSFIILRPREFEEQIMGQFFQCSKFSSFRRQLNLYDFRRINSGRDAGSYYHELFLRGKPKLAFKMVRRLRKGNQNQLSPSSDNVPNFYKMPFMGPIDDDDKSQRNADKMRVVMTNQDLPSFHSTGGDNVPTSMLSSLQQSHQGSNLSGQFGYGYGGVPSVFERPNMIQNNQHQNLYQQQQQIILLQQQIQQQQLIFHSRQLRLNQEGSLYNQAFPTPYTASELDNFNHPSALSASIFRQSNASSLQSKPVETLVGHTNYHSISPDSMVPALAVMQPSLEVTETKTELLHGGQSSHEVDVRRSNLMSKNPSEEEVAASAIFQLSRSQLSS